MRFNRIRACAIGVAAAAAGALAVMPGAASATISCGANDSITGVGASFARAAQLQWGAQIIAPDPGGPLTTGNIFQRSVSGCSTYTGRIQYAPAGSGAGRSAVGATDTPDTRLSGVASTLSNVIFGGADEAPTTTQVANATNGETAFTFDDTPLQTIPIAQSAIGIDVRLPDGCSVASNSSTIRAINSTNIEAAFEGDLGGDRVADTWGQLFPGITGTGTVSGTACRSIAFSRVVRFDSSGTTFQFKRYLQAVDNATWAGLGNTAWPAGARATVNAGVNGAGAQLTTLDGLSGTGGIAYADLATSRGHGYGWGATSDTKFWVYAGRISPATGTASPALDNAESPTTFGANCANVQYADSTTGRLPASTTASWFNVEGVRTSTNYPICALTYALAWTDPANVNRGINGSASASTSPITAGQATVVENYLDYVVDTTATTGGQAQLAAADYAPLPTGAGSVQTLAQAGVDALTYTP